MNNEKILDKIDLLEEIAEKLFNKVKNDDSQKLIEAIFHLSSLVKNIEYGTASREYYKQKLRYANKIISKILEKIE